ncbi:MAG: hypothetical protein Q6352_006505 [Candidatus Freyrarchaeum guaymaensis]
MIERLKTKEVLLFLTLFSLSLLLVAPLAGVALTQPNGVNLFSSNIQKAAQTPGSIPVGQTWTYRVTYRNATHNISATFSQHISGIVTITDWNGTQQQCYVLTTPVDYLYMMETFGESTPSDVSKIFITVSTYLNTTNYSNPRTDIRVDVGYKNGTSAILFISLLGNETYYIYKFPLTGSWQKTVNASWSEWIVNASGYNQTSTGYTSVDVNASVSGPVQVTVPAGTYEAYQINYTDDSVCALFFGVEQVQGWYSLEAQNFVKYFIDMETGENMTVELVSISKPVQTMMLLSALYFFNAQQQQGFLNLLLLGGGGAALIAVVAISFVLIRRRG